MSVFFYKEIVSTLLMYLDTGPYDSFSASIWEDKHFWLMKLESLNYQLNTDNVDPKDVYRYLFLNETLEKAIQAALINDDVLIVDEFLLNNPQLPTKFLFSTRPSPEMRSVIYNYLSRNNLSCQLLGDDAVPIEYRLENFAYLSPSSISSCYSSLFNINIPPKLLAKFDKEIELEDRYFLVADTPNLYRRKTRNLSQSQKDRYLPIVISKDFQKTFSVYLEQRKVSVNRVASQGFIKQLIGSLINYNRIEMLKLLLPDNHSTILTSAITLNSYRVVSELKLVATSNDIALAKRLNRVEIYNYLK